jgi:cytochrome c5
VDVHDPHSSFIKTPRQLIVAILLAFVVPIIVIILLVQLVTSRPTVDPAALEPEAVSKRLQPVGSVEFGAPSAPAGARTGEAIVKTVCAACHQAGVANAPKLGDPKDWAPRIKAGLEQMMSIAIKGKGAMPARGGDSSLTDAEIARAVVYMANQAGGSFKEPPAPKEAAAPKQAAAVAVPAPQAQAVPKPEAPAPAKPVAGADGKPVYDKVCNVCHGPGVAGAPKPADKAAWAPRLQQGMDALVQSVVKGKGAMPPKAGNPALTDAEIRAAVEFMVSQSK